MSHRCRKYSTNNLEKLLKSNIIIPNKTDASLRNASLTFKDMIKFSESYNAKYI